MYFLCLKFRIRNNLNKKVKTNNYINNQILQFSIKLLIK